MKWERGLTKYGNCILVLIVTAVSVLLMGICFDFYYDLNDDTMMHDIMAGIYTGTPDGHNMQTLYPLGAAIALCYRLCRTIPWYGLFLFLCQFGCFYLIGVRLCSLADDSCARQRAVGFAVRGRSDSKSARLRGTCFVLGCKGILLLLLILFQWAVCLAHLVNIQYTVTCAILSATAVFLFMTTKEGTTAGQFIVKNLPSVLLVIAAYQLRSEMLLLTFPFICLAGWYRMAGERKIFGKETLMKYGAVLGMMLCGMLLSLGIDYAAYSGEGWRDFRSFFDARTTVYDFYPELVTDDSYGEALLGLSVDPQQQTLLRNYNYGLDDRIDTKLLTRLADYAAKVLGADKDWGTIARRQVWRYFYRLFHRGDGPYNLLVIGMYVSVFVAGICKIQGAGTKEDGEKGGGYAFLWQLIVLAVMRTALWLFILLRGREPERITHSLYLAEFALLTAMAAREFSSGIRQKYVAGGLAFVLCAVLAGNLAGAVTKVREDQRRREQVNSAWQEIDDYCRQHGENFYFEDVYSTVEFSHKLFGRRNTAYANYDILGGWMCKSPLYYEKLKRHGIDSVQEALLERDDVYVIMSDQELEERGVGWMEDFYGSQGITVTASQTDQIGKRYHVYRIAAWRSDR